MKRYLLLILSILPFISFSQRTIKCSQIEHCISVSEDEVHCKIDNEYSTFFIDKNLTKIIERSFAKTVYYIDVKKVEGHQNLNFDVHTELGEKLNIKIEPNFIIIHSIDYPENTLKFTILKRNK